MRMSSMLVVALVSRRQGSDSNELWFWFPGGRFLMRMKSMLVVALVPGGRFLIRMNLMLVVVLVSWRWVSDLNEVDAGGGFGLWICRNGKLSWKMLSALPWPTPLLCPPSPRHMHTY